MPLCKEKFFSIAWTPSQLCKWSLPGNHQPGQIKTFLWEWGFERISNTFCSPLWLLSYPRNMGYYFLRLLHSWKVRRGLLGQCIHINSFKYLRTCYLLGNGYKNERKHSLNSQHAWRKKIKRIVCSIGYRFSQILSNLI